MKRQLALIYRVLQGVQGVALLLLAVFPTAIHSAVPSTVTVQGTLEIAGAGPVSGEFLYRVRFFNEELQQQVSQDWNGSSGNRVHRGGC